MSARHFRRGRDGIAVSFSAVERGGFAAVLSQFRELLIGGKHPGLMRFQPPVHIHDAKAEEEFWDLVGDTLLRHRLEAIDTVEDGLKGAVLDESAVEAWLQTLNSLRLYLADSIGVANAVFEPPKPDEAPQEAARYALYEWLGGLLDQLVSTAADTLPPGTDD